MIQLTVNGVCHTLEHDISLAKLLAQMALSGKRLAVERNGEIVPRSQFEETSLAEGDQLEVVVAVGGG